MDYVLVTYLASSRTAIAYAVGEWARVAPLRWLIRPMGGYFVRRKNSNPLYRRVLARYVALATENGVTQAVFPEGGLTRDGRLQEPKLGILSYIVGEFDPAVRDVVFVPVGLNYDRVLEDRTLIEAGKAGHKNYRSPVYTIFRFIGRHAKWLVTGRYRKYGAAGVGFGAPLSLTAFLTQPHDDKVAELGHELMARIAVHVPALSVPLVSRVLLRGADSRDAALTAVQQAFDTLAGVTPQQDAAATCEAGLAQLLLRRLVAEGDGRLTLADGAEEVLRYYAASIEQHFPT
jgi:glycerol-3-phosphate O-acyltransferase